MLEKLCVEDCEDPFPNATLIGHTHYYNGPLESLYTLPEEPESCVIWTCCDTEGPTSRGRKYLVGKTSMDAWISYTLGEISMKDIFLEKLHEESLYVVDVTEIEYWGKLKKIPQEYIPSDILEPHSLPKERSPC